MYRLFAILANIIWGLTPVYFYFLKEISAANVIVMQVISTFIILLFFKVKFFSLDLLWKHTATALLLLTNWLGYFLAIQHGRGVEASLGYLILPFMLILCGRIFFHEMIKKWQAISLGIAFSCVIFLVWTNGQFPVYGILLAMSFALYTTIHRLRKTVDPLLSLFHESIIMISLLIVYFWGWYGGAINISLGNILSLSPLGVIVVMPLVLYLKAIEHITVIAAGIYQFISPLLIMVISVFLFKEIVNVEAVFAYFLMSVCFLMVVFFSARDK